MKHEKSSKELERLIKAFDNAEQKVNSAFQTAKTESQLKINIDKQAKINEYALIQSTKEWSEKELPNAFQNGYNSVDINPQVPQATFFDLTQSVLPFIEIGGKVHTSMHEFTSTINQKINEMQKQGYVTIEAVKNSILDAVGGSTPTIKYQNGANVPISKYAEMLARTSRIETANGGILARCKDINHDLVKYLALPNCCPRCQRFNNKVFSVSGADTRFHYLYGENGPFKDGYNITHPNCRCEIMPFVEEMHQDEMEQIIKESNHFTNYSKSDKMFDEYNRQQAYNRQRNSELVEYFRLKQQLGKEFPYKRLGDFRRAKHSNSENYKSLKNRVKLTEEDISAILRYKGGDSYKINSKIYGELSLEEDDKKFIDQMDKALTKLPLVNGIRIVRDVTLNSQSETDDYVLKILKYGVLDTRSFNSFTKDEDGVNDKFSVRIIINNSCHAHDFKPVTKYENEVMYERYTRIDLVECFKNEKGQYIIIMKENDE